MKNYSSVPTGTLNQINESLKKLKLLLSENVLLSKEYLDIQEACLFLKVSESFLYKLTSTCKINYYKPNGKKIYFKKTDLENWVQSRKSYHQVEENEVIKDWINRSIQND